MPFEIHNHVGDDHYVHIGSKICLRHLNTGRYVRSSTRNYNDGSRQQVVYTKSSEPEHEDWWQVIAPQDNSLKHGDQIPFGGKFRLYHMATSKWLHSHNIKSPASGQNEVSCFGDENNSDENDHWVVENIESINNLWHANDKFRLRHPPTGAFLHSHDVGFDQGNEVTTFGGDYQDQNNAFGTRFG